MLEDAAEGGKMKVACGGNCEVVVLARME